MKEVENIYTPITLEFEFRIPFRKVNCTDKCPLVSGYCDQCESGVEYIVFSSEVELLS